MRILVVGAGASGVLFAIARKRSHPKDEIVILEHLDEPLRKILATGNGKCNIANVGLLKDIYNANFATDLVSRYNSKTILNFLDSLNIKTKCVGDLVYPISESAVTVRNALINACIKSNIKIICNEHVEDYVVNQNSIEVYTKGNSYKCDALVFASGGKSSPKLGSDGSTFELFKDHGYVLKEFTPGLCPIKVDEDVKVLDGVRVKASITLLKGNKKIHKEDGELLFKEKGLSGICIFNVSRIIAAEPKEKYTLKIDLLPEVSDEDLGIFLSFNSPKELLETYLHPKLAKYLEKENKKGLDLINSIKRHTFTFKDFYGFENSQISVGGVSLRNLKENFESIIERKVYFLGELLDVDAPCGGYNLMWAFASALYLSDKI